MPPSPSLAAPNNSEVSSANFYLSINHSIENGFKSRPDLRPGFTMKIKTNVFVCSPRKEQGRTLPLSALVAFVRRAAFFVLLLLLATRARTWPTRQLLLQVR
jgi:hypothetical protein